MIKRRSCSMFITGAILGSTPRAATNAPLLSIKTANTYVVVFYMLGSLLTVCRTVLELITVN